MCQSLVTGLRPPAAGGVAVGLTRFEAPAGCQAFRLPEAGGGVSSCPVARAYGGKRVKVFPV
jgi:hypothetical protein